MQAETSDFKKIIEGSKQFHVPLFQRTYTWGKEPINVLWNDIVDLYENSQLYCERNLRQTDNVVSCVAKEPS